MINSGEYKTRNQQSYPIQGFGSSPSPRKPQEADEGVLNQTDENGNELERAVSLTQIEVLDLISEGQIEGLVTGEWVLTGVVYETGYRGGYFSGYSSPANTSVKWLRSIYWNEVPVVDITNKYNFQSVNIKSTPGYPMGGSVDNIKTELTISRNISERLRGPNQGGSAEDFAKIYRILNKDCTSVRINIRVTSLSKTNLSTKKYGDIEDDSITYFIYFRPLFTTGPAKTWELGKTEVIEGKISQGYIRSSLINFTDQQYTNLNSTNFGDLSTFLGWEIKIARQTEDSITASRRNTTYIDSLTEIYGTKFAYPNSAIVSQKFNAEFFSQVPERAFDTRLLKIKVPGNYNPIFKTYATSGPSTTNGGWDGTFSDDLKWTDNPAWCFYDLITNNRYGLGKYIPNEYIDKWTLYKIGQTCDVLVPDGYGGVEPRFSCNLLINSKEEAYKVINDFASIFRGLVYYGNGGIYTIHDTQKNKDNFYLFTNANIEDGNFSYSTSSKRNRHSSAIVRYNDKNDFYKPAIEYIEDIDAIRKYGIRELELTAFGSTSKGQAQRFGRWALLSENLELETISFITALDGAYLRPGDVLKIVDSNRLNKRYGGRLLNINVDAITSGVSVKLDSQLLGLQTNETYIFSLLTPTYNYDPLLVSGDNTFTSNDFENIRRNQVQTLYFSGDNLSGISGYSHITFPTGFYGRSNILDTGNYIIPDYPVWTIQTSGASLISGEANYYRVINIRETDINKYEIQGLEYNDDKYLKIESGLAFENPLNQGKPNAPLSLSLRLDNHPLSSSTKIISYFITSNLPNHKVYVSYNNGFVTNQLPGDDFLEATLVNNVLNGEYIPANNGTYYFRVYSTNDIGLLSNGYVESSIDVQGINNLLDLTISSLRLDSGDATDLFGNKTEEQYDVAAPVFTWQLGSEIGVFPDDLQYRITARLPTYTTSNVPNSFGNVFYTSTGFIPDKDTYPRFEFGLDKNTNGYRDYDLVVEVHDTNGNSSAGGTFSLSHDAQYSNIKGYDIIHVSNPAFTTARLMDVERGETTNGSEPYKTDQWLTSDGNIIISLTEGDIPNGTDIAGGYLYYSQQDFGVSIGQPLGYVNYSSLPVTVGKTRFSIPIEDAIQSKFISIPARLYAEKAFIAISLFDSFDEAKYGNSDFSDTLYKTNVALVKQRNGIVEKTPLIFRNWIKINFTVAFQIADYTLKQLFNAIENGLALIDNVTYDGINIANISGPVLKEGRYYFRVNFTQGTNQDYAIIGNFNTDLDGNKLSFNKLQDETRFGKFADGFYIDIRHFRVLGNMKNGDGNVPYIWHFEGEWGTLWPSD